MLSAFRVFAKSWVAAVLIGLLIVAFAVFGIRDVFGHNVSNSVIIAGTRKVSQIEFRREFEQMRKRAEQQMGQPVSAEVAAQNGLDRQILQGLATRESFAELLRKIGIRPSDKLVADQIGKIPDFADRVSGRFDKKLYQQLLAQNELTPETFESHLRDAMAQQHAVAALGNSLQAPRAYAALAAIYALENRDLTYLTIEPSSMPKPAEPTDAQLTAFMKENAAQLTLPEFRVLTVVNFSPALVAANLPVDEAEVKKRYEFKKDTFSTPETRTLVQIPAKDAATGAAIAARLVAGRRRHHLRRQAAVGDRRPQAGRRSVQAAARPGQRRPGRSRPGGGQGRRRDPRQDRQLRRGAPRPRGRAAQGRRRRESLRPHPGL
jgi:peptidyl-prolyl cis-trans isomerase D